MVDDVAYDIIRLFCEKNGLNAECDWKPELGEVKDEILRRAKAGEYDNQSLQSEECSGTDVQFEERALRSNEDLFVCEVEECYKDILELIDEGKLFSEDEFRPNAGVLKNRHSDIKALCLHVSHACDLTCSYCFAGQGKFNGPSALMSIDVAKRAIDFLVENSGARKNLEVDFFGGEPLLNFDVVKETVAYARSIEDSAGKKFRFTLTTNGMGIDDDVIDFANRECHNVVLSLDGRKEVHDRERRAAGGMVDGKKIDRGSGSYDIIVPKFQKLVHARTGECEGAEEVPEGIAKGFDTGNTNYYIRGTFTHYNPDFTNDLYHMVDLGFTELSMEPVVCDTESRFALTEEDMPILLEEYEKLAVEMTRRERAAANSGEHEMVTEGSDALSPDIRNMPFTFYHYMLDLGHGPCIYKRISGCGSGTEYFAVTPKGELYPCHQFVGDEKYLMGDIWNGISENKADGAIKSGIEIRGEFKMCNVYAREECEDCWAKLYCSGGCAANAYHATGDILGVYDYGCRLFKKRIECAIMMKVAQAEGAGEE